VKKYVAYYRVSTKDQEESGLGLAAQADVVAKYLASVGGDLVAAYTEAESGKRADRPQLDAALKMARKHGATLVVAKLDRLARNTRFLLKVVHDSGEAGVVFCDLPTIPEGPVGKFIITQMASVAELEAGLIGQRTKAALQAVKREIAERGYRINKEGVRVEKLGGWRVDSERAAEITAAGHKSQSATAAKGRAMLLPLIAELKAAGFTSLRQIAAQLEARCLPTPRGKYTWSAAQVRSVIMGAASYTAPHHRTPTAEPMASGF
jgi:DNA invertase Pin-like site-specific DNA recombinase